LTVVVGAVVAAGCAVLPDVDHPQATVARVFGPVSQAVSRVLARGCARVHAATRTRLDRPDLDGHRTVTHSAVFAVALGALTAAVCLLGRVPAVVVLFVSAGLAARSMLSKRRRGTFGATGIALGAALFGWWAFRTGSAWWLGVPVASGCLVHCLGDALTNSGCPILWPLRICGRRWFLVGPPRAVRFRTGGVVECWVVGPVLLVGFVGAAWALAVL
jgi:membrane-bound metal-dependent hydrolase YbcI (DUF457 family)